MPYFPPEIVEGVKELDLLTYLLRYDCQELVHVSGAEYTTRTHDSLRISANGLWNWCSRGIGGRTALEYLIKVKGFSFLDAVAHIVDCTNITDTIYSEGYKSVVKKLVEVKEKKLMLPPRAETTANAESYLIRRGIDLSIIEECVNNGQIYESEFRKNGRCYKNVVFVGFNDSGVPKYANVRGIRGDFKGDANGSDKHYSFSLPAISNSDTLHLFESAIDTLSFATLLKLNNVDYKQHHLKSLAGIYLPKKEIEQSKIPVALTQFLSSHPEVRNLVLRLDNDRTGRLMARTLQMILPDQYNVVVKLPRKGKDYNEFLQIHLGIIEEPKYAAAYER